MMGSESRAAQVRLCVVSNRYNLPLEAGRIRTLDLLWQAAPLAAHDASQRINIAAQLLHVAMITKGRPSMRMRGIDDASERVEVVGWRGRLLVCCVLRSEVIEVELRRLR